MARTDGRRGDAVADNVELRWLFCEAPAELGLSAFDLESACAARIGARSSVGRMARADDYHPAAGVLAAARRVAELREALHALTPEHRLVIAAAYTPRRFPVPELHRWGRAAGVVRAAEHARRALAHELRVEVARAQHHGDATGVAGLHAEIGALRDLDAAALAVDALRRAHEAFEAARERQRREDAAERRTANDAAAERRAAILEGTRPVAPAHPIEHVLAQLRALGAAAQAGRAERERARDETAASLDAIVAAMARDAA